MERDILTNTEVKTRARCLRAREKESTSIRRRWFLLLNGWWFLKNTQNDFVVKEFHILSMRTSIFSLSFVRFWHFHKWPNISHNSFTRGPPPFTTFVNPSFSNHSLLFCPLPPPPQCVIIALSFSSVCCKISSAFAPLERFFVLSNGTLIRAFGRFSVANGYGVFGETTTKGGFKA